MPFQDFTLAVSALLPRLPLINWSSRESQGIRRLPTEIITEIFVLLLSERVRRRYESDATLWELSAFVIMGVCRRWRDIIIHAPVFSSLIWSNIPSTAHSRALVETFVERSKQPISLYLSGCREDGLDGWSTPSKLRDLRQKIGLLHFSGSADTFSAMYPGSSHQPLGNLHTLALDVTAPCVNHSSCRKGIYEDILGPTILPALRVLHIYSHTHLALKIRLSDTLQELHLSCVRYVLDLAETLAHLPRLRLLEIVWLLNADDHSSGIPVNDLHWDTLGNQSSRPRVIASLEKLELCKISQAGGVALETFLDCLVIPQSAVVHLGCFIYSAEDLAAWPRAVSAATRHLASDGDFAISSIFLQARTPMDKAGALVVQAMSASQSWTRKGVPSSKRSTSTRFTLNIRSRQQLSYMDAFSVVTRSLPSEAVTELSIRSTDAHPNAGVFIDLGYFDILTFFPHVRTLGLFGYVAPALYTLSLSRTGLGTLRVLHDLRTLILHDTSTPTMTRRREMQELVASLFDIRSRYNTVSVRVVQRDCDIFELPDGPLTPGADTVEATHSRMRDLASLVATRNSLL